MLEAFSAQLPVVHDPWFYAVAVPAVLLTGLAKSGFASGFGSLATPLIALAVPVPQAAAIMLPLLVVMDGLMPLAPLGVWAGVRLTPLVSPAWFYRLAYTGMLLTGLKLLWEGLR